MTDAEYTAWSIHHASLFAMHHEADLALFRAWKPLIMPYHFQDFMEGSNTLATENAGLFRTQHLTFIRARIRARQIVAARRELEAAPDDCQVCQACRGTGLVAVPHLDYIRDGEWQPPFPTRGIFCGQCPRGLAMFDNCYRGQQERSGREGFRKPMPMRWDYYIIRVPHWAQLLMDRENQQKDELAAANVGRWADENAPIKRLASLTKQIGVIPK